MKYFLTGFDCSITPKASLTFILTHFMGDVLKKEQRLFNKYKEKLRAPGYIMIPVHMTLPYEHWFLSIFYMDENSMVTLFIFDSLRNNNAKKLIEETVIPYFRECLDCDGKKTSYVIKVLRYKHLAYIWGFLRA